MLNVYDDFWDGRYLYFIVCCVDADFGFSHSFGVETSPQVEPDIDHYVSTTHSRKPPFFAKGIAFHRCVCAIQVIIISLTSKMLYKPMLHVYNVNNLSRSMSCM